MIQVTVGEMYNSLNQLKNIASFPMKAADAFNVIKVLKEVEKECSAVEEVRIAKVKQYGEDSSGETKVSDANLEAFRAEMEPIFSQEIAMDLSKIKLSSLPETISPQDIGSLLWLIEE